MEIPKRSSPCWLVLAFVSVLLLAGCHCPVRPLILPTPGGPYPIGTSTLALKDESRPETLTNEPGDSRELVVQVWYPAAVLPSDSVSYLDDAAAGLATREYGMPRDFQNRIVTHAGSELPPAAIEGGFPILLFSHGLGMSRETYTSLYEDLASHGFLVAAVNHTYAAEITTFPDGRSLKYNLQEPVSPGLFASRRQLEEYTRRSEAFHADLVRIWTQDLRFVLDTLTALNATDSGHPLARRMDLAKVGVFGHSFGGAAAVCVTQQDARFGAVVDLDGSLWGSAASSPLSTPFLLVNHAGAYATDPSRAFAMSHAQAGGISIGIDRTGHMDFSDAGLLLSHFSGRWWRLFLSKEEFGAIDARRCLAVTNAYLCAFFDKCLRGIDSPLLDGASAEFPEVVLDIRTAKEKSKH